MAGFLLTGRESVVWGDGGYQGIEKRELDVEDVTFCIAIAAGRRRLLAKGCPQEIAEKLKSTMRARVEHPFFDFKRWFGYGKVRYRGPCKNTQRLLLLAGISNLLRTEKLLAA